jgi:2-phosphosulfolactate phosphatase
VVDVSFTRHDVREAPITVVIDVLRATSTIVQALNAGYESVLCADGLDRARALVGPGRVLAGEERCARPPGFDLGNSPRAVTPALGDELVLATTNGVPAIVRAAELSPLVLIASLLNLDAVVAELEGANDVQLLCSGTDDRSAFEDTYVAGRLAARLRGTMSDAALIARAVARACPTALEALGASADARRLRALGLEADIALCARESVVRGVPRVASIHVGGGQRHARIVRRQAAAAPPGDGRRDRARASVKT